MTGPGVRAGGKGGAGGTRPALCANCLHPVERHAKEEKLGRACGVAIAVGDSDGPVSCPCERCIEPGTACSVDGCGNAAVHFRANNSKSAVFDMCVRHYEEAEPYSGRYFELTGGRQTCDVDGCCAFAMDFVVAEEDGTRCNVCYDHFRRARSGEGWRQGATTRDGRRLTRRYRSPQAIRRRQRVSTGGGGGP